MAADSEGANRPATVLLYLVSSGCGDFEQERAAVWRDVLPELQQYCVQHGAELMPIDVYSSELTDISDEPHAVDALCEHMRASARRHALVMALVFAGDRYGRPVSAVRVRSDEFEHVRAAALEVSRDRDARLLNEYYRKDDLASCHVLLRDRSERAPARYQSLAKLLALSAARAHREGLINKLNDRAIERYFSSSLELLTNTILGLDVAEKKTVAVLRRFDDADDKRVDADIAQRYFDTETWPEGDQHSRLPPAADAHRRLANLKNELSSRLVAADNYKVVTPGSATLLSKGSGLQQSESVRTYLDEMCIYVTSRFKHIISTQLLEKEGKRGREMHMRESTVNACYFNSVRPREMIGMSKVLDRVAEAVRLSSQRGALLHISGDECSGKTAVLSEAVARLNTWRNGSDSRPVIVQRSVGLTAGSTFAHELWHGVCMHVCTAYGLQLPPRHQHAHRAADLKACLECCFSEVAKSKQLLLIVIDNIHLVKYGQRFGSPPVIVLDEQGKLPPNVIMLTSARPGYTKFEAWLQCAPTPTNNGGMVQTLTQMKNIIALPSLSSGEHMEVVMEAMNSCIGFRPRNFQNEKQVTLQQECRTRGWSPYCSQLLGEYTVVQNTYAALRRSSDSVNPSQRNGRQSNTQQQNDAAAAGSAALSKLVTNRLALIENTFGTHYVALVCRYLCASAHGLTEAELLSALEIGQQNSARTSTDSVATLSTACEFTVRKSLQILAALGRLVEIRVCDRRVLLVWAHPTVAATVAQRYLTTAALIKQCHLDLVELFAGAGEDEPTKDQTVHAGQMRGGLAIRPLDNSRTGDVSSAGVHGQTAAASHLDSTKGAAHLVHVDAARKARNLWYQCLHAGDVDRLKRLALCNFGYTVCCIESYGLLHLASIFEETLQQLLEHDVHFLYTRVLRPSLQTLLVDNDQIASEFIGRLRYTLGENSDYLERLVEQAMSWVDNYMHKPLLVPLTCWVRPPVVVEVSRFSAASPNIQTRAPAKSALKMADMSLPGHATTTVGTQLLPTLNHQHVLVAGATPNVFDVLMFHVPSKTPVRTFTGHTACVSCLVLTRNGQTFVSTSYDGTVRAWDLITGKCTSSLTPHGSAKVACCILTHDDSCIISGGSDGSAFMSDLSSGQKVRTFPGHHGTVTSLALTGYSEFLITGSGDFVVKLWDVASGAQMSTFGGLMAPVTCMCLTGNDAFLVVGCEDETLRVFSLCSGTELLELQGHEGKALALATCRDDCQLLAGCPDGRVYVFDVHTGEVLRVHRCATRDAVTAVQVTSDSRFFLSANGPNVQVWTITPRMPHGLLSAQSGHTSAARLQSVSVPSSARGSRTPMHQCGPMLHECIKGADLTTVTLSRDHRYAACGTESGAVAMWDLETCQAVWTNVHEVNAATSALQFGAQTAELYCGSNDGSIVARSVTDGSLLGRYDGHNAAVISILTRVDQPHVVSLDASGDLHAWTADFTNFNASGSEDEERQTGMVMRGPGTCLYATRMDNEIMAYALDNDKEIRIWYLTESGLAQKARLTHADAVTCCAVSAYTRLAVTGSNDNSLKVWELERAVLTQVLVGHESSIVLAAVADDGQTAASADDTGRVLIWETDHGTVVHQLLPSADDGANDGKASRPAANGLTGLALTCDGTVAFTAGADGWLRAWDTATGCVLSSMNVHARITRLLVTLDANRLVLMLANCPHLPVLCLHNTPAGLMPSGVRDNGSPSKSVQQTSAGAHGSQPLNVAAAAPGITRDRHRRGSNSSVGSSSASSGHGTLTARGGNVSGGRHEHAGICVTSTASTGAPPSGTTAVAHQLDKGGNGRESMRGQAGSGAGHRPAARTFDKIDRSRSRLSINADMATVGAGENTKYLAPALPNANARSASVCAIL